MLYRVAIVAGLLLLCGGCQTSRQSVSAGPAAGAAVSTEGLHPYVYFPSTAVYYAPDRKVWFWLQDDAWQSGPELPATITTRKEEGVSIYMDVDHPAACHEQVAAAHPASDTRAGVEDR